MKTIMTYERAVQYITEIFTLLNDRYFESALSKPCITIQSSPKAYGHFTTEKVWIEGESETHEINIGAETLSRPIENICATMLHEMTHMYCYNHHIKDTTRGGSYHNKNFKTEAEKRGVEIKYDKKIGWSVTEPSEELKEFTIQAKLTDIKLNRKMEEKGEKKKKKSSTRKYYCPICEQSVRATKKVNIICGDCKVKMITDEEED